MTPRAHHRKTTDPETPASSSLTLWEDDDSTRMVFLPIRPGSFRMGSRGGDSDEEPVHRVRIPAPCDREGKPSEILPAIWLAETPVTQAQFARWTSSRDYRAWLKAAGARLGLEEAHENGFKNRPHHPAERVTWWEALRFCQWLNERVLPRAAWRKAGLLPKGWDVRATLPAEPHWEYACRADSETEYCNGDGEAALRRVGWFGGGETHPVRQLEPNGWGLYDMHGNVREWCLDEWDAEAYRRRLDGADAVVPEETSDGASPSYRVLRGGSWDYTARWCRSAFRFGWGPDYRDGYFGFRVCLLPGPGVKRGGAQPGAKERAGDQRRGGTPSRGEPAGDGAAGDPGWRDLVLPQRPT